MIERSRGDNDPKKEQKARLSSIDDLVGQMRELQNLFTKTQVDARGYAWKIHGTLNSDHVPSGDPAWDHYRGIENSVWKASKQLGELLLELDKAIGIAPVHRDAETLVAPNDLSKERMPGPDEAPGAPRDGTGTGHDGDGDDGTGSEGGDTPSTRST